MKRLSLLVLVGIVLSFSTKAQKNIKPIYSGSVSIIGVDFTKSKLIGESGFTDPEDIRNRYVKTWNSKLQEEKDKFDYQKALKLKEISYDLNAIMENNKENIDIDNWVSDENYTISSDEVKKHAKSIVDFDSYKEDFLILFVVESFNKLEEEGNIYFVVLDKAAKEVIFINKYTEDAGGFGLRNYWLRPFYDLIKPLKKDVKKALK